MRWARNFKPLTNTGQEWNLEVSSTASGEPIIVNLIESGELPDGFEVTILDMDIMNAVPLNEGQFSLQYENPLIPRRLKG